MKATIKRDMLRECERITITIDIAQRDYVEAGTPPKVAAMGPDFICLGNNIAMSPTDLIVDPESVTMHLLRAAWATAWSESNAEADPVSGAINNDRG